MNSLPLTVDVFFGLGQFVDCYLGRPHASGCTTIRNARYSQHHIPTAHSAFNQFNSTVSNRRLEASSLLRIASNAQQLCPVSKDVCKLRKHFIDLASNSYLRQSQQPIQTIENCLKLQSDFVQQLSKVDAECSIDNV